ncbi:hypothetical protein DEO72_LG1g1731 [Vigna unguiculata]|uniref:Uncharacterized protein n=1 Tax=Vigna unguiculata TaxID=3917 RepID=A0A4D6KKX3_VIGUN|nr:hypothetical protein DEO72_LG1g1731 [Vigna unguiculata]
MNHFKTHSCFSVPPRSSVPGTVASPLLESNPFSTYFPVDKNVVLAFGREGSRLSENPQEPLFHCSSSRLGEKGLAGARGSLSLERGVLA